METVKVSDYSPLGATPSRGSHSFPSIIIANSYYPSPT